MLKHLNDMMLRDEISNSNQLFDNAQALLALFSPGEHQFIQVNRFGLHLFEAADIHAFFSLFQSGKIWPDHPVDGATFLTEIETIVSEQRYLEREMLFQTASGKRFWGLVRVDPLIIGGDKHLLIMITNIDGLKNAELAAVRSSQQQQALFSNSVIGIVIVNEDGQIINFNPFAEQQFGYSKDELLGQPVEVLIPEAFRGRHKPYRDAFVRHPQNRAMGAGRDLFAKRKDNTDFPVEISLSHYHIGNKNYVIAFIVDISVRKSNEIQLLRQKEELENVSDQIKELNVELEKKVEDRTKMLKETLAELEISKEELRTALRKEKELGDLKSRFVSMASHEFRTPLSTILSSAYIIQQYVSAEEQAKRDRHLLKIQHAVQSLTFILEDFLSLEKLDEGHTQANFQRVTADELIAEIDSILDEMRQLLKKGQEFQFTHDGLIPITTDIKLLRNILVNLISNAIKYSPENSGIKIYGFIEGNHLNILVTDQGIGIPDTEQEKLFERFFRATNAINIQGTGLGLHIVNRYLNLIRGTITLKSELNKGTTFTVSLDTSWNC